MTASDPRVGEIQARLSPVIDHGMQPWRKVVSTRGDGHGVVDSAGSVIAYSAAGFAVAEFIAAAPADVAYLLAELRDRDEKLAKVEALADKFEAAQSCDIAKDQNMQFDLGYSAGRRSAGSILRAAVAAAGGNTNAHD